MKIYGQEVHNKWAELPTCKTCGAVVITNDWQGTPMITDDGFFETVFFEHCRECDRRGSTRGPRSFEDPKNLTDWLERQRAALQFIPVEEGRTETSFGGQLRFVDAQFA